MLKLLALSSCGLGLGLTLGLSWQALTLSLALEPVALLTSLRSSIDAIEQNDENMMR